MATPFSTLHNTQATRTSITNLSKGSSIPSIHSSPTPSTLPRIITSVLRTQLHPALRIQFWSCCLHYPIVGGRLFPNKVQHGVLKSITASNILQKSPRCPELSPAKVCQLLRSLCPKLTPLSGTQLITLLQYLFDPIGYRHLPCIGH